MNKTIYAITYCENGRADGMDTTLFEMPEITWEEFQAEHDKNVVRVLKEIGFCTSEAEGIVKNKSYFIRACDKPDVILGKEAK